VPVVRASVFGENVSQGEKAREGPAEHARILTTSELRDEVERPASKRKAEKKPEEAPIEFVKPGNEAPFPTTRIKVQSIEDIEQEIERLSREFGLAKKK
jgi:hypothetical protein